MFQRSKLVGLVLPLMLPGALYGQRPGARDSTADSTVVLRPIEVSVTRAQRPMFSVPFAVSAVSRDELQRGRATIGLDEALVTVPGLLVSNRYNPSLDLRVSIRGFGSRSAFGARGVKILLDGIPQTLPDGQGQLTNVEVGSLGSVEVLRGPASSLYGNASGGVISLRTATPSPVDQTAAGRVVAGAYGMVKVQAQASAPVGRGTLAVTGARTTTNGFRRHSEATINNVGVRFQQALSSRTTLLVSAHYADNPSLDNPGSLDSAQAVDDPRQANQRNVDTGAGKAVSQGQFGATITRRFDNGASLSFTAFGLTRDLDNPLSFAFIQLDRRAYGLRAAANGPIVSRLRYTAGIDVQHQRDDRLQRTQDLSAITRDQLERVTEIGPFAQVTLDLTDRLSYTGGVRYDRIKFSADDRLLSDGDNTGERVMSSESVSNGLSFRASPVFQPYASVSTSFESPTTTELANRPTGGGGFNPDLEPQTATNYELGVRGTVSNVLSYSAAAFHIDVNNALIPFEVPTEPGRQFFRNAGSTRHRGLELAATLQPVPEVTVVTAYTFADYEFKEFVTVDGSFNGNEIPGVPQHRLHWSVRWRAPSYLWIATDYNLSSSFFVDDANSAENDGWFTTDLRVGWERVVGVWRIAPFAGVLNLLDERYVGSITVNAGRGRYFEPSPPRNAYVGVEIRAR